MDDTYADRSKLGVASINIDDDVSGLILDEKGVQQAESFDIVLLKGSLWQGNALRGAIHRSPSLLDDHQPRVLLAIDAIW